MNETISVDDLTTVAISEEHRERLEEYREEYRRKYGEKPGVTESVQWAIDCLVIDRFPEEDDEGNQSRDADE